MADARVILFDLHADGHHVKYVRYVARQLLDSGYEVAFLTLKRARSIDLLLADVPQLRIEYLPGHLAAGIPRDPIRMFVQVWKALTWCYSFAATWEATHVCILWLDYSEPALLLRTLSWRRRNWRLYGFLIWPYVERIRSRGVTWHRRAYRGIRRQALRLMLRHHLLDAVFVHTEWAKESSLGRLGRDRRLRERVIVVPDPCEPIGVSCTLSEARSRLSLPIDKCIILFFGALRWDKGIDILLEAIADLDADVVLAVAGQEEFLSEQEVEACRSNLKGRAGLASRIGYITPDEEKLYYAAADAVILPYRRAFRGTSGVMQTALSAGKPVIVADVGELGRLVREHSLGLVVEPESVEGLQEGIRQFVQTRTELSTSVQKMAEQYVAFHHWRRMAALVEGALRVRVDRGEMVKVACPPQNGPG